MKCFYCKKEIVDEISDCVITATDEDVFHKKCFIKYEKENKILFSEIIQNEDSYITWLDI